MSQFWAWVEDLAESGPYELCSEEARHAASRRLQVGDELVVFDAKGRLAPAKVEGLGRGSARLEVGAIRTLPAPEAGFTSDERGALQAAGASALRLGPYGLRIETAAVAAMVAFNVTGTRDPKGSL